MLFLTVKSSKSYADNTIKNKFNTILLLLKIYALHLI